MTAKQAKPAVAKPDVATKVSTKPAAAEVTTKSDAATGPGELPVTAPTPPRDGPELPVIKPIPGSDYTDNAPAEEPAPEPKKEPKAVKFTCPSCGEHTEVDAADVKAQGSQTCKLCGVRLEKD